MITDARDRMQDGNAEELITSGALGRRRRKQARRIEQRRGPLADQLVLSLLIFPEHPDAYPHVLTGVSPHPTRNSGEPYQRCRNHD